MGWTESAPGSPIAWVEEPAECCQLSLDGGMGRQREEEMGVECIDRGDFSLGRVGRITRWSTVQAVLRP